jgi:hypothetical protein
VQCLQKERDITLKLRDSSTFPGVGGSSRARRHRIGSSRQDMMMHSKNELRLCHLSTS